MGDHRKEEGRKDILKQAHNENPEDTVSEEADNHKRPKADPMHIRDL